MEIQIEPGWKHQLSDQFSQEYFNNLTEYVKSEYKTQLVYPPGKEIFRAFDAAAFDAVRVVIIGQDPYHGAGQANGLSFSVNEGVRVPPSLANIYKEIHADLGKPIPKSGDLTHWAEQGVLMLNAILTVRAGLPGSHQNKGWENVTDAAIRALSNAKENVVFLLWGAYAQKKGEVIDRSKHYVLMAPHPSPFSANRGFFGCQHFSKTNAYLKGKGLKEIDW